MPPPRGIPSRQSREARASRGGFEGRGQPRGRVESCLACCPDACKARLACSQPCGWPKTRCFCGFTCGAVNPNVVRVMLPEPAAYSETPCVARVLMLRTTSLHALSKARSWPHVASCLDALPEHVYASNGNSVQLRKVRGIGPGRRGESQPANKGHLRFARACHGCRVSNGLRTVAAPSSLINRATLFISQLTSTPARLDRTKTEKG